LKEIVLSNGNKAIVDDEDFDKVSQIPWYEHEGYAKSKKYLGVIDGKKRSKWFSMHGLIMNTAPGMHTDHVNGNKLDNRRCNLRICTSSQNLMNARPYAGSSSKYKGVYLNKKAKKWRAYITLNKVRKHIGTFNCEKEAAAAYNREAIKLFGEFARINEVAV